MAEAYAFWTIGDTESCECLGATDYVYATRADAAAAVAGIAEKWLSGNA